MVSVMEKFNSIYLFTTENIKGYMDELDLTNKKIITVTASSDHIINAILKGATKILTFDINILSKYFMDLKLKAIEKLSYEEFEEIFLYENENSLNYDFIKSLVLPKDTKEFWEKEMLKYDNGLLLRKSNLFNTKYFNSDSKRKQNIYLNKEKYDIIKSKLSDVDIKFINCSVEELEINEKYDYMFLSNISDYLDLIFKENILEEYEKVINRFRKNVSYIYMAYIYDINKDIFRSDIDNLKIVKQIFKNIKIKEIDTALEGKKEIKDGVIIVEGEI
ncbi:MAG: DUF3419 family protein [Firmicutes bacterium]|nr:DUF3419 family protein [Bacillota bacterium]